ncbi:MAG: RsbR, positive regulator of sigma-B [Thermomicrobiales bacterium]|nr:RsbR, positive regulator of sigma-B [Thermomicrobiales bacterium]
MSLPKSEAVEQAVLQDTIAQQRATISELQTPVIQVWEGILALPIVGTVDTARAQDMTEALQSSIRRWLVTCWRPSLPLDSWERTS